MAPEVAVDAVADGDGAWPRRPADDEHVGDELELGFANLGADLFGAVVAGDAQAGGAEAFASTSRP